MKTIIASIALLLIVLIAGILSTSKTKQPRATPIPTQKTETESMENQRNSTPKWEEELTYYHQIIIDNNLFRPLGWTEQPKSYTDYRLLGTLTESETPSRAIIQEHGSKQIRIVTLGETLGDFHVFQIQHKQVTLKKGDRLVLLLLDETLFLSPIPKTEQESYQHRRN